MHKSESCQNFIQDSRGKAGMKGGKSGISGITDGTTISCWGGDGWRDNDWNDSGKIWKEFNSARFSRPQRNPGWKSALFQQFFPLSRSKIMQCSGNESITTMTPSRLKCHLQPSIALFSVFFWCSTFSIR